MTPHGTMFHHFHGGRHPAGQGAISADELRALLDHAAGDARILSAREWFDRARAGDLKPSACCLTFDDNLRCQFDVALPVLRERDLTAFWFVASSSLDADGPRIEIYRAFRDRSFSQIDEFYAAFEQTLRRVHLWTDVETGLSEYSARDYLAAFGFYTPADRRFRFIRDEILGPARYAAVMDEMMRSRGVHPAVLARDLWMTERQLRELHDQGHIIGLHSHTHPTRLAQMTTREQTREYVTNYRRLWSITGERPLAASHPCNSYDSSTLRVLRRLGVSIAFRANMEMKRHSPLEYPRRDHADIMKEMSRCRSPSSRAISHATSR